MVNPHVLAACNALVISHSLQKNYIRITNLNFLCVA